MATVALHQYIERVQETLQSGGYDRAVAMCQYALRTYPRCVELYRLLGQSCLETDRPDDAADTFRRVLGVDPENFVAHVGLGIVADGIGAMDEAIWQLERALEVEPNHVEVRSELQRMRARKDNGPAARRIKLSRAALGHIYLRGEQYDRAAAEFRAVLDSATKNGSADRFDLQVALAEALYRGGHHREAAEMSQQVLKLLPNALKPNLILGAIWMESGREDEAQPLFERAQSLDPENRLAAQLLDPPSLLPEREVTLEEPSDELLFPLPSEAFARPSLSEAEKALPWLKPSAATQPPPTTAESAEQLPDWLKALRAEPSEPTAGAPTVAAKAPPKSDEPEWLTALRTTTAVPSETAPSVEAEAVPSWLAELRAAEPSMEQGEAVAEEKESLPLESAAPSIQPITPTPESALPIVTESVTMEVEQNEAQVPQWLADLQANVMEPTSAAPAEPIVEEETVEQALPTPAPLETERESPALPTIDETLAIEPTPARTPREPSIYLDDSAAPPSIEAQAVPTGEAEHQARLQLARTLQDIDLSESIAQYKALVEAKTALLGFVIDDLQKLVMSHPHERELRILLADALTRAGRLREAIEQYKQMV